jgi:hypothetical protein
VSEECWLVSGRRQPLERLSWVCQPMDGSASEEPTADQRVQLYWRVKPLLGRALRFARTPETGVLAGPDGVCFTEILNGVLALDPFFGA